MTKGNDSRDVDFKSVGRAGLARKGAKASYIAPALLAAVETAERPTFAPITGG